MLRLLLLAAACTAAAAAIAELNSSTYAGPLSCKSAAALKGRATPAVIRGYLNADDLAGWTPEALRDRFFFTGITQVPVHVSDAGRVFTRYKAQRFFKGHAADLAFEERNLTLPALTELYGSEEPPHAHFKATLAEWRKGSTPHPLKEDAQKLGLDGVCRASKTCGSCVKASGDELTMLSPGVTEQAMYESQDAHFFQLGGQRRVTLFAPDAQRYLCSYPAVHPRHRVAAADMSLLSRKVAERAGLGSANSSGPVGPRCAGWEAAVADGTAAPHAVTLGAGDLLFVPAYWTAHFEATSWSVSYAIPSVAPAADGVERAVRAFSKALAGIVAGPARQREQTPIVFRGLLKRILAKAFSTDEGAKLVRRLHAGSWALALGDRAATGPLSAAAKKTFCSFEVEGKEVARHAKLTVRALRRLDLPARVAVAATLVDRSAAWLAGRQAMAFEEIGEWLRSFSECPVLEKMTRGTKPEL